MQNQKIVKMFTDIRESQEFISSRFEMFDKKLESALKDNKEMKMAITALTAKVDFQQTRMDYLESELNSLQQQNLAKDVVISGLPDLSNISCESVAKSIDEAYGYGVENISNMYIKKGTSKIGNKPYNNIVISFCNTNTKNKILQQQKEMGAILWSQLMDRLPENEHSRQIFIAERLTPSNLSLLNFCRELRMKKKITYAWSKFGTVFVKIKSDSERIKILSQNDLNNLQSILVT
jgi:Baculovirus FP protein